MAGSSGAAAISSPCAEGVGGFEVALLPAQGRTAPTLHAATAPAPPLPAALYVMLYSVHYFVVKTKMTGFFQTAFYFGYTLMFCLGERRAARLLRCHVACAASAASRGAEPPPTTACRPPAAAAAGLSVMCGSIGYLGSLAFVRRIFRNVKVD